MEKYSKRLIIIGIVVSFIVFITHGILKFSEEFSISIVYFISCASYVIPILMLVFKKIRLSVCTFLSLFLASLITTQIVYIVLNLNGLENIIFIHIINFIPVVIVAGFLVNVLGAIIYGFVCIIDLILVTTITSNKILTDHFFFVLCSFLIALALTIYITRIIRHLIDEAYRRSKIDKNRANKLKGILATISEYIKDFEAVTSEISLGTLDLSARTSEQAASLEEVTATVEELSSKVEENLSATEKSLSMSFQIKGSMESLDESSKDMFEIIQAIENIAFETNLLALNASIEAARAGDSGMGFEVVANQVKELSLKSSSQSKEVREIIESNIDKVKRSVELVNGISDLITNVTISSKNQSNSLNQINASIAQLNDTTQHNTSMVTRTAETINKTADKMTSLNSLISKAEQDFMRQELEETAKEEKVKNNQKRLLIG